MIADPTTTSQYLFCTANILQGVYIFYHHCIEDPDVYQIYLSLLGLEVLLGKRPGLLSRSSTKGASRPARRGHGAAPEAAGARTARRVQQKLGVSTNHQGYLENSNDDNMDSDSRYCDVNLGGRQRRTTDYLVVDGATQRRESDDFVAISFSKDHVSRILLNDASSGVVLGSTTTTFTASTDTTAATTSAGDANEDTFLRRVRGPEGRTSIELDFSAWA